jgi:Galactosyltransferase
MVRKHLYAYESTEVQQHAQHVLSQQIGEFTMKPAILIHSCSADIINGRHAAIRATWLPEARKHADVFFFVGRESVVPLEADEIKLDATEDRENLVNKEAHMFNWAVNHGYERMLKTETDVYFNVRRLFDMDFNRADVIGRYVGQWGEYRPDSNMYSFVQGHACWYSAKAARHVAANLREAYDLMRPWVQYKEGQIDPSLRAADLWSAQVLTPLWRAGYITVDNEPGFAYGPRSWHLQGGWSEKNDTPNWMRRMHEKEGR